MRLKSYFASDIKNKEELALQCVDIANKAKFNTDFQDVYDHLFFGDNLMLVFAYDDLDNMAGFSSLFLTREESGIPHIHLNGVIVNPEHQKHGIARLMLSRAVGYVCGMNENSEERNIDISLSARTQNPAIYRLMYKTSNDISPTLKGDVNPKHYEILKKMDDKLYPFLGDYNEKFIVKDAYSSTKVHADVRDEAVKVLFSELGELDAYVIFGEKAVRLDDQQIMLGIEDYRETLHNCENEEFSEM